MRYRPLGNTGLHISEVGFGTGNTAGLMVRGTPAEREHAVARAVELGINYFDTSPDYGKGQSEENLGAALKALGVRPIITTKVEIMPGDEHDIAGKVVASVEASLRRLRTHWVDVVEIHNSPAPERDPTVAWGWMPITLPDFLGPQGALEGLERLRQDGKARYFGLVNERSHASLAKQLIEAGHFDLINLPYNLINPSAGRPTPPGLAVDIDSDAIIPHAQAHNVGVGVFSPLARGILTGQTASGQSLHEYSGSRRLHEDPEAYAVLQREAKSLSFLAESHSTLPQAAFRFILMHPGVTTVLGGFSSLEHLEELAATSEAHDLSETEMARVEMAWQGNFGR